MYNTSASNDVSIISKTRAMAMVSLLDIAPESGFSNATKIMSVSSTAMCAMILLAFLIPGVNSKRMIPATTGIRAVNEGSEDAKYPQMPITINVKALIKLIWKSFMLEYLK